MNSNLQKEIGTMLNVIKMGNQFLIEQLTSQKTQVFIFWWQILRILLQMSPSKVQVL